MQLRIGSLKLFGLLILLLGCTSEELEAVKKLEQQLKG